jgi:hypothetical protein
MPDRDPTNGELAIMLSSMAREHNENHNHILGSVSRIEAKVDHTNGRVRRLEQLKYVAMGAIAIINVLFVPIVVKWISDHF